jgi:small subunit ribosomal protein S7
MPRRKRATKRKVLPDPKYNSILVTKFINALLQRGKRSIAEKILYGAIDIISEKTGQEGIKIFEKAVENAKPVLEVRSRRVGGATYQVPVEIRSDRRQALAIRWVINFSRGRSEKTMAEKLAGEFMAAANNDGASIKKRDDTHKMAEANKAFAHFKW